MIVVEGMDNTGKTTLVEKLRDHFNLVVKKSPGPKTKDEALRWMNQELDREGGRIIYDRIPIISERIYGPVLRGYDLFEEDIADLLTRFLRRDPLLIYCRPPTKRILNFGEREQMEGVISNAQRLISMYDKMISSYQKILPKGRFLFYNYDSTPYPEVIEVVGQYLQEQWRKEFP